MSSDLFIFLVVLIVRLGVPLAIIRYPLPAIVIALVVDAADQTVFQIMTDLDLTIYQSYDKALDVYYLAIAYIATMRNWRHAGAVTVAFFLWYYRLVGVALFELSQIRALLLIFPNTFEYFFIAIAAIAVGWRLERLSNRRVVIIAALIWIFIKLPQETWIHIAQLDTTDVLKQHVFGVDTSASWSTALGNRPVVTAVLLLIIAGLAAGLFRIARSLPPTDHGLTVDADRIDPFVPVDHPGRSWRDGLFEKIALAGLVSLIFANALPSSTATVAQIFLGVAVVVSLNAAVSQFVRPDGNRTSSVLRAYAAVVALNVAIVVVLGFILPSSDDDTSTAATAFFLLLLSLIITLFDRYRPNRPELLSIEELRSPDVPAAHAEVASRPA